MLSSKEVEDYPRLMVFLVVWMSELGLSDRLMQYLVIRVHQWLLCVMNQ